jgi:hypothetical protein
MIRLNLCLRDGHFTASKGAPLSKAIAAFREMKIRRPNLVCGIFPALSAASITGREQPISLANSAGMRGRISAWSLMSISSKFPCVYFI